MPHKTAEQLNITQSTVDALIWVRDNLRAGKIEHSQDAYYDRKAKGRYFNMNVAVSTGRSCGTVGCIGGWAALYLLSPERPGSVINRDAKIAVDYFVASGDAEIFTADDSLNYITRQCGSRRNPMFELFYPRNIRRWDYITPLQAADAIDVFLNTGSIVWTDLLGEQRGNEGRPYPDYQD